jgi:hypothetical protein
MGALINGVPPAAGGTAVITDPIYDVSDYGLNWADLGAIAGNAILGVCNLGNGIALFLDTNNNMYRTANFGATWTNIGIVGITSTAALVYCGNGIVVVATGTHIWRSMDYGVSYTNLGLVFGGNSIAIANMGNGIITVGTVDSHVWRSINYGVTWADLGVITGGIMRSMRYLGKGIVIMTDLTNHVYRSTDYGATWPTDEGAITSNAVAQNSNCYVGNGVVLLGDDSRHIYRSTDYGATWADLGIIPAAAVRAIAYLGNGIVILGDNSNAGHIWRSKDYGATWVDLGAISAGKFDSALYLGNAIAIVCDQAGHVFSSTSAYGPENIPGNANPTLGLFVQFGCTGVITPNATTYLVPGNGITNLNELKMPVTRAGILQNLYVSQRVASGTGGFTDIYTVRVNGVNTTITCTLNNATVGSDITHYAVVQAGDLISVSLVSNNIGDTSADVTAMMEID